MKTLKFYHNLVEKILDGEKTVTWRMFDDKNLTIGDQLEFIETETGEKFAEAEITKIVEKKLGAVEEKGFDGHETYKNPEEMLAQYQKYYGNKVTKETLVKVISFKLLKHA
ncbi:MAG: ASCH domain-containing protein [Patescibacteria group bacterium]|nr:ASCH domain-containing protein [Patescibacteria group bacterium]